MGRPHGSSMTNEISRPQKLDALTSLRFIAAAMIVIGHAHPLFGSLGIANAAPLGQGVSFITIPGLKELVRFESFGLLGSRVCGLSMP